MGKFIGRMLAAAAISGFGMVHAAQAQGITFETVQAGLFFQDDSFNDGGYRMTVGGDFGVVDTAAAFFVAQAPIGNDTQFYAGLNDGFLSVTRPDGQPFRLNGFDAGFVAPAPVGAGISAGRIVVFGTALDGGPVFGSWEFAVSDDDGFFAFTTYNVATDFSAFSAVSSLQFVACVYAAVSCVNPAENLAQFALDNVNVAVVPEPSTYALFALGLAGLAWRARRATRANR